MKFRPFLPLLRSLFVLAALGIPLPVQADEPSAPITQLLTRFLGVWNKHDPAQFTELFVEDGDIRTAGGTQIHGKPEIQTYMQRLFANVRFKETVYSGEVRNVRFLTATIALVTIDWEMKGERDVEGEPRPEREGLLDWVLVKSQDRWLIVTSYNTDNGTASAR